MIVLSSYCTHALRPIVPNRCRIRRLAAYETVVNILVRMASVGMGVADVACSARSGVARYHDGRLILTGCAPRRRNARAPTRLLVGACPMGSRTGLALSCAGAAKQT